MKINGLSCHIFVVVKLSACRNPHAEPIAEDEACVHIILYIGKVFRCACYNRDRFVTEEAQVCEFSDSPPDVVRHFNLLGEG